MKTKRLVQQLIIGIILIALVGGQFAYAQIDDAAKRQQAWYRLDDHNFAHWPGVTCTNSAAKWMVPGKLIYVNPDGIKGWYSKGLVSENDGTFDARNWYGLRFQVYLDKKQPFNMQLLASLPQQKGLRSLMYSTIAKTQVQGRGWHTITVPFSAFDYRRGEVHSMKYIKEITFTAAYANNKSNSQVLLKNVKLVSGNNIRLQSDVTSLPAGADSTASYTIQLSNCLETGQTVSLALVRNGWEGMPASVSPSTMYIEPGQQKTAVVKVKVPAFVPRGTQETQTLTATTYGTPNSEPQTMQFITTRRITGSFLVRDEASWQEVSDNIKKYDWARQELKELIATAEAWQVPQTPNGGTLSDQGTKGLYKAYIERDIWATAVAWRLTGNKGYGEKTALFLRRFADPINGYPGTLHATLQGQPQEGGFMEGVVRAYNLIQDAGLLSPEDKKNIESCLRLYIGVVKEMMDSGVSNWNLFNTCPAAQCALALQDMTSFNYLLYGPSGIIDQFRYGTLNDGWWYEMSLSYNLGCAENMTSVAIAAKAFGIDLLHAQFPVSLSPKTGLRPFEEQMTLGMSFSKFGPLIKNHVCIKDLWDGIAIYPDYRGVMFGMGDGHEELVSGNGFEMAYYAYRDTTYAAIIKEGRKRNLIYAVADLPAITPKIYAVSGYSPNAGIAVLRSQTENRDQSEQIQAAVKFGTHGSYHGHFDRASLLSLMRNGRSFYSPETTWYGYNSYMYKWWVQVSLAHNMVVVDGKMQEPVDSKALLFHSGKMMQIIAVETNARWSNPPYMGGYDQVNLVNEGKSPFVPIPDTIPSFENTTGYTEPVLQRRLTMVTDDYVLQADYLKAQNTHTFDDLIHLRGAVITDQLPFIGHNAQFDTNPLGSGQFITNVNRYELNKTIRVASIARFAPTDNSGHNINYKNWETGGINHGFNQPGELHIDSWNLWPRKAELQLGYYPEAWPVNKKLVYKVTGDSKILATDSLGTWILGKRSINVDIKDVKELKLITHTDRRTNTLSTLFWANAKVITSNGKEIPLSQLKMNTDRIIPLPQPGKDYDGGPVRIAGDTYADVLPAEPQTSGKMGSITVELSGLDAVRFKAVIGGDWPVGDEEQLRKTVDYRVVGKEARFVTILEPYESKQMIKAVQAINDSQIRVELNDGRVQEITIQDLDGDGKHITAVISERRNGKMTRTETACGSVYQSPVH